MKTTNTTMRAIVRQQFGGPEQLQIQEIHQLMESNQANNKIVVTVNS